MASSQAVDDAVRYMTTLLVYIFDQRYGTRSSAVNTEYERVITAMGGDNFWVPLTPEAVDEKTRPWNVIRDLSYWRHASTRRGDLKLRTLPIELPYSTVGESASI